MTLTAALQLLDARARTGSTASSSTLLKSAADLGHRGATALSKILQGVTDWTAVLEEEAGDGRCPWSCYWLGLAYCDGLQGLEQNDHRAVQLWHRAQFLVEEEGCPGVGAAMSAKVYLGVNMEHGLGCNQ